MKCEELQQTLDKALQECAALRVQHTEQYAEIKRLASRSSEEEVKDLKDMIDELEMQLEEKTNETTRLSSQLKPLVALPAQLDLACQQYEASSVELAAAQAQLASLRDAHAQVAYNNCRES